MGIGEEIRLKALEGLKRGFHFFLPFGRDKTWEERRKLGTTVARGLIQGRAGPPLLVLLLGWVCVGKEQSPKSYTEDGSYDLYLLLIFFPFL